MQCVSSWSMMQWCVLMEYDAVSVLMEYDAVCVLMEYDAVCVLME